MPFTFSIKKIPATFHRLQVFFLESRIDKLIKTYSGIIFQQFLRRILFLRLRYPRAGDWPDGLFPDGTTGW